MAPKRKKAGLTRMDAAVDQMSLIGFSSQLVRKTVRNLLKVYGDDGWKLIEENAYKVLVDVILDEQEEEAKNLSKDASEVDVDHEDATLIQNAESSEAPLVSIEGPAKQEGNLVKPNDDDHSANEINLQKTENTSLALRACDVVPTRTRKPCYGWISDDEDEDEDEDDEGTKFVELAPAT